jgi:RHH-type transcriptional regulator, rel operon repressor / antitoxin RelB
MSTTLTLRIDETLKSKLESLAEATQRSKSFLAAEALERYVAEESWQVAEIKEGMGQADAGVLIAGEDMDKWLASWGKDHELPPPKRQRLPRR